MNTKVLALAGMLGALLLGFGLILTQGGQASGPQNLMTEAQTKVSKVHIQGSASVELAEEQFKRKLLPQARETINKLPATDPGVADLKLAIDVAIDANESLQRRKYLDASRELAKLGGSPYEFSKNIDEIRQKVDWDRKKEAADSYDKAMAYFAEGQYEAARSKFDQAGALQSGMDGSMGTPSEMAEASRLARLYKQNIDQTAQLLRETRYAEAARVVVEARDEFDRSRYPNGLRETRDMRGKLEDYFNFSMMMARYNEGFADEALEHFDKISPDFVNEQQIGREAERVRTVRDRAKRALEERSWRLAEQVVQLEPNADNAFHRQMKELKEQLDMERSAEGERLMREVDALVAANQHEKALEVCYQARQVLPGDENIRDRHEQIARIMISVVHRSESEDLDAEKRRVYNHILRFSDPQDNVYAQARHQLRSLAQ